MNRRRPAALPLLLSAMLGTATVAGCESAEQFPPICPSLALLKDAADLQRFAGGGRDISELVVQARLTAVPATCTRADLTHVRASLQVAMDLTRGPAAQGGTLEVPYFVGVTEGGRVLDEQDYRIAARFPSNIDQVQVTGDTIDLLLPITREKTAAAYQIFIGFRLSPEDLAANRARTP